jgi:hypothetical protein
VTKQQPRKVELPKAEKELQLAFRRLAKTPDGILVLRWLMELLGWKAPMLAMKPSTNEIVESSTIYNVSKRDVWITIRQMLPPHILNPIEMERKPTHEDDED